LATGRKIRVLTIVDTYSRFSPAVDARFNYKGEDVVMTLERVCRTTGYPKAIRVDQGSEFISRDLDLWAYQKGVILDFSRPHSAIGNKPPISLFKGSRAPRPA
jgi:putative transposase